MNIVNLTDNEKGYLRIAYKNGYRYVATDYNGKTYFYKSEPKKLGNQWGAENTRVGDTFKSMTDFCTAWEDKYPAKVAELLGIDDTDWSKVKPFTPVWVRDRDCESWTKAYFIRCGGDNLDIYLVNYSGQWVFSEAEFWKQCKLATQEEIDGLIARKCGG